MKRFAIVALGATALAACDGLKEAMSAHQDVVARAGSQELTVSRLGDLIGKSRVPINKETARELASLWVDYQLLGQAAAKGDSLKDPKAIDAAMHEALDNARAGKFFQQVAKTMSPAGDTVGAAAKYASGEVLAARHILLMTPQGMNATAKDSVRRQAEAIRAQVTPQNFAQVAQQRSQDGSARNGGALGVFPKGAMVPEFEKALVALKPGEISPVVQTQYGYHIIYRQPFSEVRDDMMRSSNQRGMQAAESTYIAKLQLAGDIQVRPSAAKAVKDMAADPDAHQKDGEVVATSKAGKITVGDVARIVASQPDPGFAQQLRTAPDSVIPMFLKQVATKDLVLHQADSAKVTLDTAELNNMHRAFGSLVTGDWMGLHIAPNLLADSAKSESERERLAATRVDTYLDALVSQQAQFVDVPKPLETVLRTKYDYKLIPAGLDRAVERAKQVRTTADSSRRAQQPASAVPMPSMPSAGQAPVAPGAGAAAPSGKPAPTSTHP